mmetsp:Transcript_4889/g.10812  ORF Transcript_4889/g.10812 Transcript_4889/m.10812 type:complete len:260 (-) Transcript_4889:39-818(-)
MAARAGARSGGLWRRWVAAGVAVGGCGVVAAAGDKERRRAFALVEAGVRGMRLVGTCAMIVADYKMQRWRQSDQLSGDAAVTRRRVEDAEQALEVSDRTAKHAEQRLGKALARLPPLSRAERQELQVEARRTMDLAAECAEQLVALRKVEEAASLSKSGAEEVHQRSADRLLTLARTNKGAYLKIAQHLSQMDYLLPDAFPETLRVCLDDAPQTCYEDVAATVREDLGRPIEEMFVTFERTPLASASLGSPPAPLHPKP